MEINKNGTDLAKVLWYYNILPEYDGYTFKIVCPFHEDVNPSMIVNLENGSWYCFGCGLSGDASKFVALMENQNDLKSYQKFLMILKSDKCSSIKIRGHRRHLESSSKDLYNEAYDYYHGLRKINWSDSGDSEEEVIEAKNYMLARGFSENVLNKTGCKITYNYSYQIIFPILDNGKFKGWICRTTKKEIEEKRKYLYNKGFHRSNTVVGNYGSKDWIIVVEGFMDRLKFLQFGVNNVVALFGWKMSLEQENKLKKAGIKYVISALDNDDCGRKGTKYLQTRFKTVRFKYLKGFKDPGEMEKDKFEKMFNKTMAELKRLKGI